MKLLSALTLSLGLSSAVWAEDEAANAERELWANTVRGLFLQSCDQFNKTVRGFDNVDLSGRDWLWALWCRRLVVGCFNGLCIPLYHWLTTVSKN